MTYQQNHYPPQKRNSATWWIIGGCGVILVLAALCACGFFVLGGAALLSVETVGTPPAPVISAATPIPPTPTPVPPEPTDTPVPPTEAPTSTPIPTDTPEPAPEGPPPEVVTYMLEMTPKLQAISDSLSELTELTTDPKFGDESWKMAVVTNALVIQETHKEFMEMEVPPEMAEFHAAVLDVTGDYSEAMDYLLTGIDNMNAEDVWTAVSLMGSALEKMQKADRLLEEYMAQFE